MRIIDCGTYISIVGDVTEDERIEDFESYDLRFYKSAKLVQEELKQRRAMELVAAMESVYKNREEAGAPKIYATAYGGGVRNEVSNSNTSTMTSSLTATTSSSSESK